MAVVSSWFPKISQIVHNMRTRHGTASKMVMLHSSVADAVCSLSHTPSSPYIYPNSACDPTSTRPGLAGFASPLV